MARVSVVTGGGTGIGRAVAAELARNGDRVIIVGRRAEVLAAAAKGIDGDVRPIAADLGDPDDVARLRDEVADAYGRVDVLVNNAGGNADLSDPGGDGLADVARQWIGNFQANVLTVVLPTEALSGLLADDARVVLVSSIAAIRGSGAGSYGSAKAALHPYAYNLATALGPRGITVNVVAPGFIEETEFFGGGLSDDRRAALIDQTANHRPGTPADVAATIAWLTSPPAGHLTAQIIQVNGGAERGR